jgi:hypothetical protein
MIFHGASGSQVSAAQHLETANFYEPSADDEALPFVARNGGFVAAA